MARLSVSDQGRLYGLKTAVCLGLAGGVLSNGSLWLSGRFLPLTPIVPWFPPTPFPLDAVLLAALILLIGWVAVARRPSIAIAAVLALMAFLAAQDQGRLYPSVYEYAFLLAALALYGFSRPADVKAPLGIARLIVVCVYVWSGLQKLDPSFAATVFPALVHHPLAPLAARIAPWLEIIAGLGLLLPKHRAKALVLALAMHLFSFIVIGPWGYWLPVAWTWNLFSAAIAFVLFFRASEAEWKSIVVPRSVLHWIVAALFGFMPILNFFGAWDSALSFNVFSGNVTNGTVLLSDALAARLPPDVRTFIIRDAQGKDALPLERLSYDEFHAGLYAEPRIFRSIERKFCTYATKPDDAVMIVRLRTDAFGTPPPLRLDCAS